MQHEHGCEGQAFPGYARPNFGDCLPDPKLEEIGVAPKSGGLRNLSSVRDMKIATYPNSFSSQARANSQSRFTVGSEIFSV